MGEPLGRLSVPRRFDIRKGKATKEQRTVALRALLDRPDRRAMGLHPVALSLGSGLRVSGIASGASHLDAQELERLIEDGHAIAATATISADAVGPICAAWIGQEFALAAEDAGAPELPFELEARPAIDQRQLHEGNSVLRGQPPRVEPSVAEIDTRLEVLD